MTPALIVNPAAGAVRESRSAREALARRALDEAGVSAEVFVTERPGHAHELARDLVRDARDLVIAWGGDGTVNEVASALVGSMTALGIVPSGSGNGLARELGLPRRPAAAIRAAAEGRTRRIDAGELGGRLFFNIAGVGFDAEVALRFNQRPGRRRGLWPYVAFVFDELRRYRPSRYTVALDDETFESEAFAIILANSPQYGNAIRVAPDATLDDGLLDVLLVDHRSIPRHLWRARHLLLGTIGRAEGIVRRKVRGGSIVADRLMACHADGEAFTMEGRVDFRIHPGAVRLRQ
jgi:diacylglycerol kinase (ATP)